MRLTYDLLGAYLDSLAGLDRLHSTLLLRQRRKVTKLKATQPELAAQDFLDGQPLDHRFPSDALGPEELLHRSSQGEFKRRTRSGGLDARLLSQMLITFLYGAWEDRYREQIALRLGHPDKNALKCHLFGDIREIRNAIVHNQGKATEKVEKASIMRWFRRGDDIYISAARVRQLLDAIDCYITDLCGLRAQPNATG